MTLQIVSTSSSDTESVAERLGQRLRGTEVIELVSDLGGGKTTFVRGLAKGLGSEDHVSSPTFKISNVYKAGNLELHHFDFYRLSDPGVVAQELSEVIGQSETVVVIEWAQVVNDVLPEERLRVEMNTVGEVERQLKFSVPSSLQYLMEGLAS